MDRSDYAPLLPALKRLPVHVGHFRPDPVISLEIGQTFVSGETGWLSDHTNLRKETRNVRYLWDSFPGFQEVES